MVSPTLTLLLTLVSKLVSIKFLNFSGLNCEASTFSNISPEPVTTIPLA